MECINHRAEHLGKFGRCPIALLRAAQPLIDHVCQAYAMCRRFNLAPAPEDAPLVLAFDEEIRRIEALEVEDQRRIDEMKRRAQRG